jgi:aminopeptidase YwaD
MKNSLCLHTLAALLFVCTLLPTHAQQRPEASASQPNPALPAICARCIRAHMDFLASDALHGRGSGTHDELLAATYIASELQQYGIEPAGDAGGFIQRATFPRRPLTATPRLTFKPSIGGSARTTWIHGKQFLALALGDTDVSGPLQKYNPSDPPPVKTGAFVFITRSGENIQQLAFQLVSQGAVAVIVPESTRLRSRWNALAAKIPSVPVLVQGNQEGSMGPRFTTLAVNREAAAHLARVPDGTRLRLHARAGKTEETYTWNVVGKIPGSDPAQQHNAIVLTAHLDHLGIGTPVNGDDIYNGADDDASGTTAVLELARVLAIQPKPQRTVIFALFGSEEKGGLGSIYFRAHPPVPLKDIAAYLEFEMIGRSDSAVPRDTLWLTGWKRTDLGPELAKHGAHLVGDPHPAEHFFRRSDNYVFAQLGVIAQTVSSYGLHGDYHQPSDDLAHIDFQHMDEAIESMLGPVLWLANSDFVPHWNEGGQP